MDQRRKPTSDDIHSDTMDRAMNGGGWSTAFGEGWLGSLIVAVVMGAIGAVAGWIARKPMEQAAVLEAVNGRLKIASDQQAEFLKTAIAAHAACEEQIGRQNARLDLMEAERAKDRGLIELLRGQVAQEKQIAGSLARVKGDTP